MKTMTRPPTAGAATGVSPFEQLEAALRMLVAEHETLLTLAGEHRRAISQADAPALNRCVGAQNVVVQRIAGLERQRQTIVRTIVGSAPGRPAGGARTPTMTELSTTAPEPVRGRLVNISAVLRDLLNKLHREHRALRQAAEELSMHMEGLMRQVCRGMSHTGTYARGGSIDSSVQVVSSVDVRS